MWEGNFSALRDRRKKRSCGRRGAAFATSKRPKKIYIPVTRESIKEEEGKLRKGVFLPNPKKSNLSLDRNVTTCPSGGKNRPKKKRSGRR